MQNHTALTPLILCCKCKHISNSQDICDKILLTIFKLQKTLQQTRIPFSYDKLRQPFFMIDNILQKLLPSFF